MNNFKANTTYTGRFITDADSSFEVTVIKRTAKTVTFIHPHHGTETRGKIHLNNGVEFFFPMGQSSMAPTIHADKATPRNSTPYFGGMDIIEEIELKVAA
jgi:hypothetical protein